MSKDESFQELQQQIQKVIEADTDDFLELGKIINLNPLIDLAGADLRNVNLRRADLKGADLNRTDLSGANLIDANLEGANLSRTDLSGSDLRRADLRRANLIDTDLSNAIVEDTLFGKNLGINQQVKHDLIQRGAKFRIFNVPSIVLDSLMNLNQWLKAIVSNDYLLETNAAKAISFRNKNKERKLIEIQGHSLELLVEFIPETEQETNVKVELSCTEDEAYLPNNLQLILLNEEKEIVAEAQVEDGDRYIGFNFTAEIGDNFSIKVILNESNITEDFVI